MRRTSLSCQVLGNLHSGDVRASHSLLQRNKALLTCGPKGQSGLKEGPVSLHLHSLTLTFSCSGTVWDVLAGVEDAGRVEDWGGNICAHIIQETCLLLSGPQEPQLSPPSHPVSEGLAASDPPV